jgi:hypothetical protein
LVVVLHVVADARRTGFGVVVRVGEAAEGVLKASVTLYEEHDCDAEGDDDDEGEEEEPGATGGALIVGGEGVGLDFEDLCVADVGEETLERWRTTSDQRQTKGELSDPEKTRL